MNPLRTNQVTVDLGAIAHNARALRAHVPASARLMAVVKADAYGHGAEGVARTALRHGAGALGVAIPEEGVALRDAGLDAEILVLGGIEPAGAQAAAEYGLTQTVFDVDTMRLLEEAAIRAGREVAVHLKIDTGMGRVGIRSLDAMEALLACIQASPHLRLTGAFTHFATADEPAHADFYAEQKQRFAVYAARLRVQYPAITLHAANSAALLKDPGVAYDMVRAGIALYGAPPVETSVSLRQAMRWHTRAVLVKEVPAGEPLSYGGTFVTSRPSRIMTLPVGYADGYRRALSNRAQVLVHGRRAPIVGRVCMDQTLVDVTDIPEAQVGEEVVLLGNQGADCITAAELASWADTISYEMFLAPSRRVPRVVLPEMVDAPISRPLLPV